MNYIIYKHITMQFCPECESHMPRDITINDEIIFQCGNCNISRPGDPDDTLLEETYLEASIVDAIHDQFVENSAYDDAGNIVMRECKKCGINFMTQIQVGSLMSTVFTCTCGNVENM